MNQIRDLQSNPAVLLTLVIILISICIVIVVLILLYRLENEKRITRAALELKKITNSIRAGLVHFVLEDNCRILYASEGFYGLLGYDKNTAKEENKSSILDFVYPNSADFIHDTKQQLGNKTIRSEVQMQTREGRHLSILMNGNSVKDKDGKHTLSVVFVDVTEFKRMQELILLEGERYRIATELSNDILFEYHIKSDDMLHANKYKDIFGIDPVMHHYTKNREERMEFIHPDDWGIYLEYCDALANGKAMIEVQIRMKDKSGEYIWCQIMGKTISDDLKNPLRVIGKIVNVDAQKRELEALEYKATRDPLTGVYNKEITNKKIDKFILGNKDKKHIMMLIDFDDFKRINDTYGHLQGDKVLSYVINRIKEVFDDGEIIGRVGGDEFVVFAGNINNPDQIMEKASILNQALDTVYDSDNNRIKISGSIGIATYPESGLHYEQLMEHADQALYQAKEHGKNNFKLYTFD